MGAGVACQAREPLEQVGRRICMKAQLLGNGYWSKPVADQTEVRLAMGIRAKRV